MATYEPSVIEEFADKLYEQARTVVAVYALIGVLVGGAFGAAIGNAAQATLVSAIVGAAIVGVIASRLGQQRAFALRLQAQVALCQVQIEANTRRIAK